ncbi:glycosyltransferase family 2 protein [Actinokineospora sp. UTMC 2448]|uniref:glycosyltransferase family 2 protein n=1 Tax=Actinokineospora sp. UTMC 2448 TaxID=2268449 RepID=UPI0021640E89|nr:glycosyltransferase family 2 protein [Actinokineospora sp. UTMC 2448]UVS78810.1 Putative glycosyltransferase EpsH [Actinokineospora sp. UTMC 2448]
MLVSVIVPNYNGARTLPLCLASVRAQTYPDIELIVADDASTDDSAAIAEAHGARVVRGAVNGGCAVARNLGVAAASGDVLFFLDSDVAIEPDAVQRAVDLLAADPSVGGVCGVEDPEPLIPGGAVKRFRAMQYYWWSISSEGPISFLFPNICAIRASVFAETGPFNPALRHTEEVDYGHRINHAHTLLLTAQVRGRHDHDGKLKVLLRKLFHRGRMRIPLYMGARRFAKGFETATRAYAAVAALLAVVTLPSVLLGPLWALLPAGLFALSVGLDAGMYRFAARHAGVLFLPRFVALQFLVNVTIALAVGVGVLHWLTSPRFRGIYTTGVPA